MQRLYARTQQVSDLPDVQNTQMELLLVYKKIDKYNQMLKIQKLQYVVKIGKYHVFYTI